MKLKFDSTLAYQQQAINAVVQVFAGEQTAQTSYEISSDKGGGFVLSELGVMNNIKSNNSDLLANVNKIQAVNGIEKIKKLQGREFSVEMETGTGKTYVYLRTIFELAKTYGLRKFIIVVPSVAVREGVLKSIEMAKEHFQMLYDNEPFNYFVYDSKKLGRVRQFATSNAIQIMVINIQSFQKDIADKDTAVTDEELKKLNVINRENDKMSGYKPIDFISGTKPVVIIDEPQSVDNTEKAKEAIKKLNPAFTLRYSATHRTPYNLLYKLDPIRAYDLRLVKRIEVASVRADGDVGNAYIKLLKTDNRRGIKAQVEIYQQSGCEVKLKKLILKNGDNLFDKSNGHEIYHDGYIVSEINCTPGAEFVEFANGQSLSLGQAAGGMNDAIMQQQVRTTVEEHLRKERALKGKGVKVLSLFFIDRVANYRVYQDDGTVALGKIGEWFEAAYQELAAKKMYKTFAVKNIAEIHDGYFSKDRKGCGKDTSGKTKEDDNTYNLIMRDKERLLSADTPLRFIFSHSALREGWDSPNVFQICTLNETRSPEKKRQEIGRGLRLPVNEQGERVHDENINRLTVITNEAYEDFAKTLQKEFEQDYGIQFGEHRIKNARKKRNLKFNKQVLLSPEFDALWNKIKQRTRYRVNFDTKTLIKNAVSRIKKMEKIKPVSITTTRVGIDVTDAGVTAQRKLSERASDFNGIEVLPDLLAYLQKHTDLTRHTLAEILKKSGRIDEFKVNPQKFMSSVAHEISRALHDLVLAGIQYEKVKGHYWEMCRLKKDAENDITRYLDNLHEVQNKDKCIFDRVEFDSEVERQFAKDLDNHRDVRLFVKLPAWFKIDTPIGAYNPDWAFMTENHDKLYFVRETKSTTDSDLFRKAENQKTAYGKRHFKAINVDYGVVTRLSEVEF